MLRRDLARHAPFLALLVAVGPLVVLFSWHASLATIGDDSISYLNLAKYFVHPDDPFVAEWVPFQSHFPPLFPLVLAATGGADNLLIANLVVAGFAILGLAMLYGHAAECLASRPAAAALAAAFLLLPTAWISMRGIMTETQFLFFCFATLWLYESRLARARARSWEWLLLGVLLAGAWLTRSAGTALVAAYALCVAVRAVRERRFSPAHALPALPLLAMAGAWLLLRPAPQGDLYANVMKTVLRWLQADPLGFAAASGGHLVAGWIASFTAEAAVSPFAQGIFVVVGVLGVAGSVRRAWSNHLDGWYALASLAMMFLWVFREDAMRRLLYPIVPLLLLHAVLLLRPALAKLGTHRLGRWAWPALVALPLAFTLPALLLVAEKASHREPLLPGFPSSMAGMKDFYTTIRVHEAKANAARGIAMLAGLEALRFATPPDARIMWMRPDYVAVLGGRRGVPWFYHGGIDRLMRDALHSRADYIIASNTYKSDMLGEQDDRFESVEVLARFARPVLAIPNAVLGVDEFVLMKVDAQALEALVRERAAR